MRGDIWGRAAADDTNVEFVGIKSIGSGFNRISLSVIIRPCHPFLAEDKLTSITFEMRWDRCVGEENEIKRVDDNL